MKEVDDPVLCKQIVNQAEKHLHNPVLGPGDVHDWDGDKARVTGEVRMTHFRSSSANRTTGKFCN